MYLEVKLQQVKFYWCFLKLKWKRWGTCDLFRCLKSGKIASMKFRGFKARRKLTLMLLDAKQEPEGF